MTHLTGAAGDTKCGLSPGAVAMRGDDWSHHTTDCPKCMPSHAEYLNGLAAGKAAAAERGDPKAERIAFLERKREATKADLLMKFEDGDYHGVQDCASDLRDIESELKGLRA